MFNKIMENKKVVILGLIILILLYTTSFFAYQYFKPIKKNGFSITTQTNDNFNIKLDFSDNSEVKINVDKDHIDAQGLGIIVNKTLKYFGVTSDKK